MAQIHCPNCGSTAQVRRVNEVVLTVDKRIIKVHYDAVANSATIMPTKALIKTEVKIMLKYVVINPDGTYAGVPCNSKEEAIDLAAQKKGRVIGEIIPLPMVEHIHCPVNGYDCPYWKNGICKLDDPMNECDDFASVWDEDDEYICNGGEGCATWDKGE